VSILMIKQLSADGVERLEATPTADYTFSEGDVILAMGPNDALKRLRLGSIRRGTD